MQSSLQFACAYSTHFVALNVINSAAQAAGEVDTKQLLKVSGSVMTVPDPSTVILKLEFRVPVQGGSASNHW